MKTSDPYDDVLTELDDENARTVTQLRETLGSIKFNYPVEAVVTAQPNIVDGQRGYRWYLAAAAVAAAIVTGVVVSNLGGQTKNVALAEWTPQPQPLTIMERSQIEAACETATHPPSASPGRTVADIDDPGSDLAVPDLAVDPNFDGALIDRRGNIAAVVATTADANLTCAAHFSNGEWHAFAAGVGWGGKSTHPTASRAWGGDLEITMISGLALDATSIEIDAPGLVSGTAPVIDDRYVLWVPSSSTWEQDTTITVRNLDADGSVLATVDLHIDAAPR